jgi:hypothetical protein
VRQADRAARAAQQRLGRALVGGDLRARDLQLEQNAVAVEGLLGRVEQAERLGLVAELGEVAPQLVGTAGTCRPRRRGRGRPRPW